MRAEAAFHSLLAAAVAAAREAAERHADFLPRSAI